MIWVKSAGLSNSMHPTIKGFYLEHNLAEAFKSFTDTLNKYSLADYALKSSVQLPVSGDRSVTKKDKGKNHGKVYHVSREFRECREKI